MKFERQPTPETDESLLERISQQATRLFSFIGLGLMLLGYWLMLAGPATAAIPGAPALDLGHIFTFSRSSLPMTAMSAGILLIALVPAVRVLLALGFYLKEQRLLNVASAVLIILTLLGGIFIGQ